MGTPDPLKLVQRLKQLGQELAAALHTEQAPPLLGQMQSALEGLELALKRRKQGGRPKGRRHKVNPTHIEAIRRWKAGDRSEYPVGSIRGLAAALRLSRQTVYTILAEIRLALAPAQPDVDCETLG
jgi:hypothetical protein